MTLRSTKRKTASKRNASIAITKIHPEANLLIDCWHKSLVTADRIGEEIQYVAQIRDLVCVATVQDQETGPGRQGAITIGKGQCLIV